jgi:ABC-2 type transport system ATP-binding protein
MVQAETHAPPGGFAGRVFSAAPPAPAASYSLNGLQALLYSLPSAAKLPNMIEVTGLTKRYGAFTAVNNLSFSVHPGEVMGLVGPNGAGKTTTLRCAAGIIPPTAGTLRVAGVDLAADPVAAKRQLAFLPDEPRLFDHLTVRQHLRFAAKIYSVADAEARADALLAELEIADKAGQLPAELSRGMKQKLVIACGLLHGPKVLFFDEPLTGLDPLGIRRMKDTIRRLAREGAAIILSSHLLSLLEEVCTHVLIMKQGQRIALGTLPEVVAQFSNGESGVSLEEVFIRATGGSET